MNSILQNVKIKQYPLTALRSSFHLNGHTLGFHPHTQKLQLHLLTQGLTLGVKGLIWLSKSQTKVITMANHNRRIEVNNACNWRQARENACNQVTIGFQ